MPRPTLTEVDVHKLVTDKSGNARAETAAKIADNFGRGVLSDNERKLAEEIFRVLVKDAEVRVREALAQNLKENANVPHDVALSLAKDVDSVALPVLQFSEVLSDEDLVELVRTSQDSEKQKAIAQRSTVSEKVSDALVETKNEDVVTSLVSNVGANISEGSLQKVVDHMGSSERVQAAMVVRPRLPVAVTERLVTMVSEHLKDKLVTNQDLPAGMATDIILQSRERATVTLSTESDENDVEILVKQLNDNGRLTPSIVVRALCMGDMRFFETALALLTGLPLINVRQLAHDSGPLGLKALFEKSGLPEAHWPAVRAAVDVAKETDYDGLDNDRERYSRRMIERILTQYGDLGVEFEADDLEYLLTKMSDLPSDIEGHVE